MFLRMQSMVHPFLNFFLMSNNIILFINPICITQEIQETKQLKAVNVKYIRPPKLKILNSSHPLIGKYFLHITIFKYVIYIRYHRSWIQRLTLALRILLPIISLLNNSLTKLSCPFYF